jgi:hypothetical protein
MNRTTASQRRWCAIDAPQNSLKVSCWLDPALASHRGMHSEPRVFDGVARYDGRRVFNGRILHRDSSGCPFRSPTMVDCLGLRISRVKPPGSITVAASRMSPSLLQIMITKQARRSKEIPTIFTIGQSTRPIGEFLTLLQQVGVDLLVDVRSIPRSRTNRQFNTDALPQTLGGAGISYQHLAALGGLRHRKKGATPSINTFWKVAAFRNLCRLRGN